MILKSERQTNPSVPTRRSKSILEILIIEQIFHGSVKSQVHLVPFERERIASGQISLSVAFKAINICIKGGVAKYWREITARRKQIEIHPKALESLSCDQRKLMVGNTEGLKRIVSKSLWLAL
jgi:hypothetical protein